MQQHKPLDPQCRRFGNETTRATCNLKFRIRESEAPNRCLTNIKKHVGLGPEAVIKVNAVALGKVSAGAAQ